MKASTKEKLFEAWLYCEKEEKSTEFMLQYMQDFAGVSLDVVVRFVLFTPDKEFESRFENAKL